MLVERSLPKVLPVLVANDEQFLDIQLTGKIPHAGHREMLVLVPQVQHHLPELVRFEGIQQVAFAGVQTGLGVLVDVGLDAVFQRIAQLRPRPIDKRLAKFHRGLGPGQPAGQLGAGRNIVAHARVQQLGDQIRENGVGDGFMHHRFAQFTQLQHLVQQLLELLVRHQLLQAGLLVDRVLIKRCGNVAHQCWNGPAQRHV